jgi:hypothetical protein
MPPGDPPQPAPPPGDPPQPPVPSPGQPSIDWEIRPDVRYGPIADIGNTEFGVEAGTDLIDAANDHDRNTGGDQTVFGYLRSRFQN